MFPIKVLSPAVGLTSALAVLKSIATRLDAAHKMATEERDEMVSLFENFEISPNRGQSVSRPSAAASSSTSSSVVPPNLMNSSNQGGKDVSPLSPIFVSSSPSTETRAATRQPFGFLPSCLVPSQAQGVLSTLLPFVGIPSLRFELGEGKSGREEHMYIDASWLQKKQQLSQNDETRRSIELVTSVLKL